MSESEEVDTTTKGQSASAGDDAPTPDDGQAQRPAWTRHWPAAVAAVVASLVGYGGGRLQGTFAVDAAQARHEEAVATLEEEKKALAGEKDDLSARLELLRARRLLHQASLALEEHNYGIAQERVKTSLPILRERSALTKVADELADENFLEPGRAEALRAKLRTAIVTFDTNWSEVD